MKIWIVMMMLAAAMGCGVEEESTTSQSLQSGDASCSTSDGSPCFCGTAGCDGDPAGGVGGGVGGGGTGGGTGGETCVILETRPCPFSSRGEQRRWWCCSGTAQCTTYWDPLCVQ